VAVDRLPRPENPSPGKFLPRRTAGVNPEHPIDHRAVVPLLTATASVRMRQRLFRGGANPPRRPPDTWRHRAPMVRLLAPPVTSMS
jgi:hypothetical protein